jgi:hypothetical protein
MIVIAKKLIPTMKKQTFFLRFNRSLGFIAGFSAQS